MSSQKVSKVQNGTQEVSGLILTGFWAKPLARYDTKRASELFQGREKRFLLRAYGKAEGEPNQNLAPAKLGFFKGLKICAVSFWRSFTENQSQFGCPLKKDTPYHQHHVNRLQS